MPELFRLLQPKEQKFPIVINVPHSGEYLPEEIRQEMVATPEKCKRDLDLYVDQIWEDAYAHGVTLLIANVSRYVVDLNRASDDISEKSVVGGRRVDKPGYYGTRGVVWPTTTDGTPVLSGPLSRDSFRQRIQTYHEPYHRTLQEQLDRVKEQFGFVIMIDAHSMPSKGRSGHPDSGHIRADVVPGNAEGTTCADAVSRIVESHFSEAGYSVAMNNPYKGAWDTRHYGEPSKGQHAIQIELNRKLYMNETSFDILEEGMAELSRTCCSMIPKLGALTKEDVCD